MEATDHRTVERKADVRTDRGFLTASISTRQNDARDQKWPGTPSTSTFTSSLVPLWIFVHPTAVLRNARQVKRSTHNRSGLNTGNYICGRVSNGWFRFLLKHRLGFALVR